MKQHFINFFQSFYSIKPYDKALRGQVSTRFNTLVLFITLSIVISITVLFIGVYARFHVIQPIMKSFPDIQIVNGYAQMEDPTPIVLEGRTSPINHYFLEAEEGRDEKDTTVKVLIDTQKDGYDPKVFNKSEYHRYTVIVARDGVLFNERVGKENTSQSFHYYRDLKIKKYLNRVFLDIHFWTYLIVMASFVPPFMAIFIIIPLMIIGWRLIFCCVVGSSVVHYIMHNGAISDIKKSEIVRSVLRFAFFMLIPSALYFIVLRHFVYCPMWLYYIIVTVGLVIALLKYEQKRRAASTYAETAGIKKDHDHPSV